MDTDHRHKKKLSLPGGNSFKSRIFLLVGGGIALIIVIILASSLLFGGKESNAQALVSLAAKQQEIIRISDLGITGAIDPNVKALAQTTKLSVASQQKQLITYLASKKKKASAAQLAANKNTATDKELTAAAESNKFDEIFEQTIKAELAEYNEDVEKAYNSASNVTAKNLLKTSFVSTEYLLK